ncbi:3942_t:CDS:1, partial [Dentiscutata erythropus]
TMNVNELITNNNIFTNTPNNLDESSNASNSDFSLPSYQSNELLSSPSIRPNRTYSTKSKSRNKKE